MMLSEKRGGVVSSTPGPHRGEEGRSERLVHSPEGVGRLTFGRTSVTAPGQRGLRESVSQRRRRACLGDGIGSTSGLPSGSRVASRGPLGIARVSGSG